MRVGDQEGKTKSGCTNPFPPPPPFPNAKKKKKKHTRGLSVRSAEKATLVSMRNTETDDSACGAHESQGWASGGASDQSDCDAAVSCCTVAAYLNGPGPAVG